MLNNLSRSLQSSRRLGIPLLLIGLSISGALAASQVPAQARAGVPAQPELPAGWVLPPDFDRSNAPPMNSFWARRLTGYFTARDGTNLRYSVLLPKGRGPFPVIMNYSGYDPGAIGGASYLRNDSAMSTSLDRTLLQHGYAVMGVNARGTGCSEGEFDFLARSYGTDGADAVEWAAAQPWSTGAIGMANWSWAGMSQVATASERPPHLKAIAPGMVLTDPRLDSWALGGVPSPGFITGWWDFLHSRWLAVRKSAAAEHDDRCVAQADLNYAHAEEPEHHLPTLLMRHPLRDEWHHQRVILDRVRSIQVPVLSVEAFQDEATTARGGYYQLRLDPSRVWILQTSGDHDLYESLRFRGTLLAFLDHFVKGTANGFEQRPHLEIWQETTTTASSDQHTRDEQAVPSWVITRPNVSPELQRLSFWLNQHGELQMQGPGLGKPDEYAFPVPGPTVDTGFAAAKAWGPMSPDWRTGSVAYTSTPLTADIVTDGPASLDLWLSTTVSDADVQATLTEIRPDGQERYVQRGWLRMSARALDTSQSTELRPILLDTPGSIRALTPGVPVLGRVELTKFSYAFRRGSRIRIWIDTPSATGGNDFNHLSIRSMNSVWHDAGHPSRLVLGVLSDVKVPAQRAACDAVVMQPCRRDPLAP